MVIHNDCAWWQVALLIWSFIQRFISHFSPCWELSDLPSVPKTQPLAIPRLRIWNREGTEAERYFQPFSLPAIYHLQRLRKLSDLLSPWALLSKCRLIFWGIDYQNEEQRNQVLLIMSSFQRCPLYSENVEVCFDQRQEQNAWLS